MEGVCNAVLGDFDGFCVFGGKGAIFERGREEVNYCERKALLSGLGGRLGSKSIRRVSRWGDKRVFITMMGEMLKRR